MFSLENVFQVMHHGLQRPLRRLFFILSLLAIYLILIQSQAVAQNFTPDNVLAELNRARAERSLPPMVVDSQLAGFVTTVTTGNPWPSYEEMQQAVGQPNWIFEALTATSAAQLVQEMITKKPDIVLLSENTRVAIGFGFGQYLLITGEDKDARCRSASDPAFQAEIAGGVLAQVNQLRASLGLNSLTLNSALNTAARLHSEDMAANNYFSHDNLRGEDPGTRVAAQGYAYYAGENIAKNFGLNAQAPYEQWLNSPPHYGNMTAQGITEMGLGIGGCGEFIYYTQLFGTGPSSGTDTTAPQPEPEQPAPPPAIAVEDLVAEFNTLPNTRIAYSPTLGDIARAWGQDRVDPLSSLQRLPGRSAIDYFPIPLIGSAAQTVAEYAAQNGAESLSRFNVMGIYDNGNGLAYLVFARLRDVSAVQTTGAVEPPPPPPAAVPITAADVLTEINTLRTGQGLSPLVVEPVLTDIAAKAVREGGLLPDTAALGALSPRYNYAFGSSALTGAKELAQDLTAKNADILMSATYSKIGMEFANGRYTLVVIADNTRPTVDCAAAGLNDAAQGRFAGEILAQVNALRQQQGLAPLTLNGALNGAAIGHSQDMADNNFFDHTNLRGAGPVARLSAVGFGNYAIGENIAQNFTLDSTAVYNQWLNSPDHYANMVNPLYTEMGIGAACSSRNFFFTQVFAGIPGGAPDTAAPDTTTPPPAATILTGTILADGSNAATIRSNAGAGYERVGAVANSTSVEVLEQDANTGWTKIRTPDGVEGWVLSAVVRDIQEKQAAAPDPAPDASPDTTGGGTPDETPPAAEPEIASVDSILAAINTLPNTSVARSPILDNLADQLSQQGKSTDEIIAELTGGPNVLATDVIIAQRLSTADETLASLTATYGPDFLNGYNTVILREIRSKDSGLPLLLIISLDLANEQSINDTIDNADLADPSTVPPSTTDTSQNPADNTTSAPSDAGTPPTTVTALTGTILADGSTSARIRSNAGAGYEQVGTVANNTVVEILQQDTNVGWTQIRTPDGIVGWVLSAVVRDIQEGQVSAPPSGGAETTTGGTDTTTGTTDTTGGTDTTTTGGTDPNAAPPAASGLTGTILADGSSSARIRSNAGAGYEQVGTVANNTVVEILQQDTNIGWTQIRTPDGIVGWVLSAVVRDIQQAPVAAPGDTSTGDTSAGSDTSTGDTGAATDTSTGDTGAAPDNTGQTLFDDLFAAINTLPNTSVVRVLEVEASFQAGREAGRGLKELIEEFKATPGIEKVTPLPAVLRENAQATLSGVTARFGEAVFSRFNSIAFVPVTNQTTGAPSVFIFSFVQAEVVDPTQPPQPPDPAGIDTAPAFVVGDLLTLLNAQPDTALNYSIEMEIIATEWARLGAAPGEKLAALPGAAIYDSITVPVLGATEAVAQALVERAGSLADYNSIGVFRYTQNEDALYVVLAKIENTAAIKQDLIDDVVIETPEDAPQPDEEGGAPDEEAADTTLATFSGEYLAQLNATREETGLPRFVYSRTLQQAATRALNGEDPTAWLAEQGILNARVIIGAWASTQVDAVAEAIVTDTAQSGDALLGLSFNAAAVGANEARYYIIVGQVSPEILALEQQQDAGPTFGAEYLAELNEAREFSNLPRFAYSRTLQQAANRALLGEDAISWLAERGIFSARVIKGAFFSTELEMVPSAVESDITQSGVLIGLDYNAAAVSSTETAYFIVLGQLSPDILAQEQSAADGDGTAGEGGAATGEDTTVGDDTGGETGTGDDAGSTTGSFASDYLSLLNDYRQDSGLARLSYNQILQEAANRALRGEDALGWLSGQGISVAVVVRGGSPNLTDVEGAIFLDTFEQEDALLSAAYNAAAVSASDSAYYIVLASVAAVQAPADGDGDGFADTVDQCPAQGDAGFGLDGVGCPIPAPADSDGDGVIDTVDLCPTQGDAGAGVNADGCPLAPAGAPDSDGDGFADDQDRCPTNSFDTIDGCSTTIDNDGDGYFDSDDECPYTFVTPETDDIVFPGCPKP